MCDSLIMEDRQMSTCMTITHERMLWGSQPMPHGARPLGYVRHPENGLRGVALLMPSGQVMHGAAGVIRPLPRGVPLQSWETIWR